MDLDPKLQLALRNRPNGRADMYHKWRDLTFLHYSVEPEAIQELIPKELTVDTFEGKAWIGLVPFWMTGVRMSWLPAVPGTHEFPETNVRTYVHLKGLGPGVWFFSLNATNRLAVWGARKFFGLPYFNCDMSVDKVDQEISYRCQREESVALHDIVMRVGEQLPFAMPGSLEFFLIERYLLYSMKRGKLHTGLVHHGPYPIHKAEIVKCEEKVLLADGVVQKPWEHVCYSPGVDVEVFGIKPPDWLTR